MGQGKNGPGDGNGGTEAEPEWIGQPPQGQGERVFDLGHAVKISLAVPDYARTDLLTVMQFTAHRLSPVAG